MGDSDDRVYRDTDTAVHLLRDAANKLAAFYERSSYDGLITNEAAVDEIVKIWRASRVTSLGTADEINALLEVFDRRYDELVADER
ncbi:hypothetical protein [Cryobacterium sp. PH31-O1]|uniref:hypothetical protein n=1 Tax=Cryobacterium sp. PH31-O1 TaxID=3046306 RepID=UPI0024BAC38E|nr:hypothetical protein [Cryobacterium sp. PH31-O1]MDJ0338693.1 hypothetical protein [Cryobacterium sp. PH31-O1]